jgi:putative inorganic carbon (hco3(-)) transporter
MLRSLWLLSVYLTVAGLGVSAPFVLTLGYVWVDTFQPQNVAYMIMNQIPVALLMGAAAVLAYVALDRRDPPRLTLPSTLQLLMAAWITLTMMWAEVPSAGWDKWNWAFKSLVFSAFIPLAIRSRIQIEAFIQIYVVSLAANFVPFGLKTLISGGGYGRNLGLLSGNAGLAEGGLLSTACLMAIPLALFLGQHSVLWPRRAMIKIAYWVVAALALVTALGTFERSAAVGLVALASYMLIRSRHKIRFAAVLILCALGIGYVTSDQWVDRISTIGDYSEESSALVRVLVWKWTIGYALSHPVGGGFSAYLINSVTLPNGTVEVARAFHSVFFELLGEQGWVGLGLFVALMISTLIRLRGLSKRVRDVPGMRWCSDLSDAIQSGLIAFLAAGAFVGIAFQPMCWYFVAVSISLTEYVRRVAALADAPDQVVSARPKAASTPPRKAEFELGPL